MLSNLGITRRALLAGGVGSLALPGLAWAQSPRPTPDKLDRMINRAFENPNPVNWANPQIVGFSRGFRARSLAFGAGSLAYHFHVADPRQEDDLIFFTHEPTSSYFKMHRTGMHLRRIASALNHSQQVGGLKTWSGPDCDADFEAQLAYWANKEV